MFSKSRAAAGRAAKSETASPSAGRPPCRAVLWAILGVALLMLTTFVIFGALGGGMIKSTASETHTVTFSDFFS